MRLIASLGLLVLFIGISSISIYQVALSKASQVRADNQVAFFSARLEQLERDWEIQSRDFKVRLEFTRMLEDPTTAKANLQAFMTVQGTDRRFHYLLIQTRDGQKLFDFGKDLDLPTLPAGVEGGMGHYLDPESGTLYRVFEMPIWLGEERGMVGRCAVFFRIDNALLGQLGAPGLTISAIHQGVPVASSGGYAAIDRLRQPHKEDSRQTRTLPWGEQEDCPIHLYIDAPIVTLFSSMELVVGMCIIPIVDGLMLWFTVGLWLMCQTRRITELGEAVGEYTIIPQVTETMQSRLMRARENQVDEIADVAIAIGTMVNSIDRREQEREEAIARLRASETRIREITTALGDGVLVLDSEGLITFVNPWAERLLGFSQEELLGKDSHAILHHHVPLDECPLYSAIGAQQEYRNEMEHFIRKDGYALPVALAATPIYRESEFGGTVITFQDITERLAVQQTLHEAKIEADRANSAKSEFLANMSHEIRTPMNAIIGLSDLALALPGLGHTLRDYLSKILTSSMALLSIINDILDYSKVEAGRLDLEEAEFCIEELLTNVANLSNVRAEENGLEVLFEVAPAVPSLLIGDQLRLNQVLNNLVGNAVKFTESGGIHIIVAMLGQQADTVTLQFSVRDTGIGMTEEQAKNLFQPFTQADGSITRRFGGTGLGLTISKHLVEKMGGELVVDSVAGMGSCFSFAITMPVVANEGSGKYSPVEKGEQLLSDTSQAYSELFAQASPIHGAHVLLVEDNAINQTVAQDLLGRMGLQVTVADDGEQALDFLQQETMFDVVLMDLQMPVMDGFEATRRIREMPHFMDLPVIAMTAAVLDRDREACEEVAMNDHVAKPIVPQNLLAVLLKWIKSDSTGVLTCSRNSSIDEGEGLPTTGGFDQGQALALLGGNTVLFKRLLCYFGEEFSDAAEQMAQLIAAGEFAEAAMLAHKIKGAAGNLGAKSLHQAADSLEAVLEVESAAGSAMAVANELASFNEALAEVMEFVATLRVVTPSPEVLAGNECDNCDWRRAGELFGELRGLIDNYDFVPQELVVELGDCVGCRSLRKKVEMFGRYVEATDYDMAKVVLSEIS